MHTHHRHRFFRLPGAPRSASGALLLFMATFGALAVRGPREAMASVSIAASVEDLARTSSVIARVTPLDRASAWEGGRIVTTTRVRVDDVVAGSVPERARELSVRTLGGRVGKIGQVVEGEASFSSSEPSVVFLAPFAAPGPAAVTSAFVVVGRAQGQIIVRRDVHGRELVGLSAVGELVDRRVEPPLRAGGRRITELAGAPLQTLAIEAKRAWEVGHAK